MSIQCIRSKPCIISQCNSYHKSAHTNILLRHYCRNKVTSALVLGQFRDNEKDVLSNKLMNAINNSKSIKSDDKCHNVLCQSKRSNKCDVTYNFAAVTMTSALDLS
jgi:hypothetical protein